jgi:hypothetical protein
MPGYVISNSCRPDDSPRGQSDVKHMTRLRPYRHLVGYRPDRIAEQINDVPQLQQLYGGTIPDLVTEFLATLSDCVLYYRFEATSRVGKPKPYSHFVMSNIGPELDGVSPFPVSIIGKVLRYRTMGLPEGYLPLTLDSSKTLWLWLDVPSSSVLVPKGTREFGTSSREWTIIAPSFTDFIDGLQLDVSPLLQVFRLAGTANVQPSMREWLQTVLGEQWETEIEKLLARKKKTKPADGEPS